MDNRFHGLRFDIYERVHLTEDVAGIAELEEIELVPRIQVVTQEEHAALRGHLLLQGIYRGEEDEVGELYHQIPVEITIPMNRVTKLEDIAMEIENFDVDLLSLRSLNITGVLTLYGVDGMQTEEAPGWGDDEYTAVHTPRTEEDTEQRSEEEFAQEQQYHHGEQQHDQYELQREQDHTVHEEEETLWSPLQAEAEPQAAEDYMLAHVIRNEDQEIADYASDHHAGHSAAWERESGKEEPFKATVSLEPQVVAEPEVVVVSKQPVEDDRPEEPSSFAEPSVTAAPVSTASSDIPVEEKKEPKVAFGSKKETGDAEVEAVPFSSLIPQRRAKEAELTYDESTDLSVLDANEEPRIENGKWRTLFQNGFQDENEFRKVRLCIVQRAETLETIAERYELSARELQTHNRLSEQMVEAGQVLYIP